MWFHKILRNPLLRALALAALGVLVDYVAGRNIDPPIDDYDPYRHL